MFLIHFKSVELNFKLCVALQVQMAVREFGINFLCFSVKCANRKWLNNSLDTFFYEEQIESVKTGKTGQQSLKISGAATMEYAERTLQICEYVMRDVSFIRLIIKTRKLFHDNNSKIYQ